MRKKRRDERGQAILEYILILSVAAFGASMVAKTVVKNLDQGILKLGATLERDLKSGRTPASVFKN